MLHSNNGGWQSTDNLFDWTDEVGQILHSEIQALANRMTAVLEETLQRRKLEWKVQAWANLNRRGNANSLHFHPGAFWSGTLCVDDGGIDGRETLGGTIEFVDPRTPLPLMYRPDLKMAVSGTLTAGLSERIYPRTGQMLLFPSWLGHRVLPYVGDGNRVSVAFNCSV